MTESRHPVKTIMVNIYCNDCSKKPNPGCILENTGDMQLTYPAKYKYRCPLCKEISWLDRHYPYVDYEKINYD